MRGLLRRLRPSFFSSRGASDVAHSALASVTSLLSVELSSLTFCHHTCWFFCHRPKQKLRSFGDIPSPRRTRFGTAFFSFLCSCSTNGDSPPSTLRVSEDTARTSASPLFYFSPRASSDRPTKLLSLFSQGTHGSSLPIFGILSSLFFCLFFIFCAFGGLGPLILFLCCKKCYTRRVSSEPLH